MDRSTQTDNPTIYTLRLTPNDERLDYTDPYLDIVWTPILGPCAISLLRALAHTTRANTHGPTTTSHSLAASIGVSSRLVLKALKRLHDANLITLTGDTISLGNGIPTAPTYRLAALPEPAATYATNRHRTLQRHG